MAICSAFGCENSNRKTKNVTFHKFPRDKITRQKWRISMKRKDFEPSQCSVVCSAHFKSTDYETVGQDGRPIKIKLLKKSAVPSVFTSGLPSHLQAPEKKPRRALKRAHSAEVNLKQILPKFAPVCLDDGMPCCEREAWEKIPIVSKMCNKCALYNSEKEVSSRKHRKPNHDEVHLDYGISPNVFLSMSAVIVNKK